MALQAGISSGATSMVVDTVAGLPSVPFTLCIDPNTAAEELVEVTNTSGTTLSPITRAIDGTLAQAHLGGAVVLHVMSGRDLGEAQAHIAADTDVHGVTGTLVGRTMTQTLTNKTISGASNTLIVIPQASVTDLPASLTALSDAIAVEATSRATADSAEATARASADSGFDTRLDLLETDSGVLTSGITAATGWSLVSQGRQKIGNVATATVRVSRTGAALTVGANGNVADVQIAQLPVGYRPGFILAVSGFVNSVVNGYVNSSGGVYLTAVAPGQTVVGGTEVALSGTWVVA